MKIVTLSRNQLKIIAMLSMVLDHIGCVILQGNVSKEMVLLFRGIGRLSFVIFCYLIVQGFFETANFRKYAIRMCIFAVLSELPYDMAFGNEIFDFGMQNVLFTYLFGLLMLKVLSYYEMRVMCQFGGFVFFSVFAYLLKTDYAVLGMLLMVVFYYGRYQKKYVFWGSLCVLALQGGVQMIGAFALPICMMYDSKKEDKRRLGKFFYWFYPIHLLFFAFIRFSV